MQCDFKVFVEGVIIVLADGDSIIPPPPPETHWKADQINEECYLNSIVITGLEYSAFLMGVNRFDVEIKEHWRIER